MSLRDIYIKVFSFDTTTPKFSKVAKLWLTDLERIYEELKT